MTDNPLAMAHELRELSIGQSVSYPAIRWSGMPADPAPIVITRTA